MLSEEKVKIMAKAAVFEKGNRKQLAIHRFYKKDYVSYHILLIWLCVTLAFVIVLGGIGLVYVEEKPEVLQSLNWGVTLFTAFMIYVIVFFIYVIISLLVYSLRYEKSEREIRKYQSLLKQLERIYQRETPAVENLAREFEEPPVLPVKKTVERAAKKEKPAKKSQAVKKKTKGGKKA